MFLALPWSGAGLRLLPGALLVGGTRSEDAEEGGGRKDALGAGRGGGRAGGGINPEFPPVGACS